MKRYLGILLFFISQMGFAQEIHLTKDSLPYKFKSNWKYSKDFNQDLSQIDFDDSKLLVINSLNGNKELRSIKFNGSGWFRLKFHIDSTLVDKSLALMFNFAGVSELYLDGKLFKKYGDWDGDKIIEYYNPRDVPEPITFSDTGTHVMAIKLKYFEEDEFDWLIFDMSMESAEKAIENYATQGIAITFIINFLGVIFLTLGIIHLFFFLYYRSIISNLFFSLFMLCLSAVMGLSMFLFISNNPVEQSNATEILFFLIPLLCLLFTAFIHFIFYEKTKVWIAFILVLAIACFVLIYFESEFVDLLLIPLVFLSLMHGLIRIIVSLFKKQQGAWIIGTGILFSILFLIIILATGLSGGINVNTANFSGQLIVFGVLLAIISIPLSMSIYQAWSFSKLNKDLSLQLIQVQELSEKTIQQELEKQHILENQKEVLEIKVEERTQQLSEEKKKSDDLLLNILPHEVAEELKEKGFAEAKLVDQVTVIFTDFKGFTTMAEQLSPQALVHDIHECFSAFDRIMGKYGIEKIKTIGDAYMAASGLPSPCTTHAADAVKAALEMAAFIEDGKALKIAKSLPYFEIRIGVHSGPVVAGIVGIKKFAYDIWGDTVNTASRMESSGEIGKVNISETTYELIKNEFQCSFRGEIDAKGKGKVKMYFVD